MRPSARTTLLLSLLFVAFTSCGPRPATETAAPSPPARPRAADLVVLDTLRADAVGLYDPQRGRSPNLDRFGEEAVVFDQLSASSNNTLSTHSVLFASLQPRLALQRARNGETDRMLPAVLSNQGIEPLPDRLIFAEGRHQPELMVRRSRYKVLRTWIREADTSVLEMFDLQEDPEELEELVESQPELARDLWRASRSYFESEAQRLQLQSELPPEADQELQENLRALGSVD